MSSSSSSDHRHKKRKHKKRHRSRDDTSLLRQIRDEMQSISNRVTRIEGLTTDRPANAAQSDTITGDQRSPAPTTDRPGEVQSTPTLDAQHTEAHSPSTWGDRMEQEGQDLPDYDETVFWEPELDAEEQDTEVQKLSSTTTKIVEEAFSRPIPNERRRTLKRILLIPDTPHTKCPKLDPAIQSKLPKQAKEADRTLARLQTLVLDSAAPLISTLEAARKGSLTTRDATESAQLALKLLGNASANISMERRRKATTHLNPELSTLVEDEESFIDAAPLLFGKGFDQRARDHTEAIKSLKKATSFSGNRFFQRGHPSQTRGGGSFRGRGTRKFSRAPQTGKRTQ